MTTPQHDIHRAADYWDAEGAWESGRGAFWLELPIVQQRLNAKVSGDPNIGWVRHTLDRHFRRCLPLDHCLSIGCGKGGLERELAGLQAFTACTAFDVSRGSIVEAQRSAIEFGYDHIDYSVRDGNTILLAPESIDAVWAKDALHHVSRLEHALQQIAVSLRRPGGLFILYEYVGPDRFQFPERQRRIIEACHELLPLEFRRVTSAAVALNVSRQSRAEWTWLGRRVWDKIQDGDLPSTVWRRLQMMRAVRAGEQPVKTTVNLPTARSVEALDPSEAVRSSEIVPMLQQYFDIVEFTPLGGSILQFLLADIAGNFRDEAGEHILDALFRIEDSLMATGDLASDFAYIVCAPK